MEIQIHHKQPKQRNKHIIHIKNESTNISYATKTTKIQTLHRTNSFPLKNKGTVCNELHSLLLLSKITTPECTDTNAIHTQI